MANLTFYLQRQSLLDLKSIIFNVLINMTQQHQKIHTIDVTSKAKTFMQQLRSNSVKVLKGCQQIARIDPGKDITTSTQFRLVRQNASYVLLLQQKQINGNKAQCSEH